MTCRQLQSDAIEFARGVALDPSRDAALKTHLRSCPRCAALVERQRAMSAALRWLARERSMPAMNPCRLNSLLAAFDRPRARSRRSTIAVGLSLAASVLIVVGLSVGVKREMPAPGSSEAVAATLAPPTGADTPFDVAQGSPERSRGTAFVVLPGATALPRLEHGQVIQVDIPSAGGIVRAEVLIGQDGLARAARLVQ
jgi:hypothetical protein